MQIQYDLTKGYFNYYNESQGIMIYRNKLLKNNNIKIHSFLMYLVKNVVFLLLPFAFDICFYLIDPENLFSKLLNILLCIDILFLSLLYRILKRKEESTEWNIIIWRKRNYRQYK